MANAHGRPVAGTVSPYLSVAAVSVRPLDLLHDLDTLCDVVHRLEPAPIEQCLTLRCGLILEAEPAAVARGPSPLAVNRDHELEADAGHFACEGYGTPLGTLHGPQRPLNEWRVRGGRDETNAHEENRERAPNDLALP